MNGEYLPLLDTRITYADDLPASIHAFVTPTADGGHTIVVNSRLDDCSRKSAVLHEINHILNRHLDSQLSVALIEKSAYE